MEQRFLLKMIANDVKLGINVKIPYPELVNLYGCEIGDNCFIGPFVEIQKDVKIGKKTRISSHSFICEGVNIGEDCFIAHGVSFVNDKFTEKREEWILRKTFVGNNVRIGSNSTILPVDIGNNSVIGAGSVVTKNIPSGKTFAGNPAKEIIKKNILDDKKIPFLDLKSQYQSIKEDINKELQFVMDNTCFVLGSEVKEFEQNFADFCNKRFCIALNSGTSALHLALIASGIKQGDEVIIPVNTFIATAEAVVYTGAKPVFVDIEEKTYNIDASKIEEKITPRTKAIIPVHLYGQPADMDKIIQIAKKYNLRIIEDCCQAHGAEYKGKKVPITDIGCFSFYPGKNLGAYGEAGAVVTDNPEIANLISILRDHGQKEKYYHDYVGYNYRMDGFQGAVLNVKLKHLNEWTEKRRENAKIYNSLLKSNLITPYEDVNSKHVYHLYVVRVKNRENIIAELKANNIDTGIHYPVPLHIQKAFSDLNLKTGSFPIAEKVAKEILSLPMYAELTKEQANYVAETLKKYI